MSQLLEATELTVVHHRAVGSGKPVVSIVDDNISFDIPVLRYQ
jgi:hypothetical protein